MSSRDPAPIIEAMSSALSILIDAAAVLGAVGMVLLVAGSVASTLSHH